MPVRSCRARVGCSRVKRVAGRTRGFGFRALLCLQTNRAFVFIKPHAVNDKVKALVKDHFVKHNITIKSENTITSEVSAAPVESRMCPVLTDARRPAQEIDAKKLIDNHYYAIASKATILKPHQLNVPRDMFEQKVRAFEPTPARPESHTGLCEERVRIFSWVICD